jgi:hypothetical protein
MRSLFTNEATSIRMKKNPPLATFTVTNGSLCDRRVQNQEWGEDCHQHHDA